jgi:hypothetical protein
MPNTASPARPTRRRLLAMLGGGAVVAVAAPTAWVATRTPALALAPWDAAGAYPDPRLRALSWALLAPNPHNRQPWIARLDGAEGFTLWRDPERDLPVTDPFARQLTIGMGCFLELARIAAAEEGYALEADLFPQGEGGPVATCRMVPGGAAPDPLFAHVLARRSHKEAFEARPVTQAEAAPLAPHGELHLDGPQRDALRRIAHDAWLAEAGDAAAWQESVDLLRIGKAEINAQPDGIDVGGPMVGALAAVGLFTREAASDPDHPGSRGTIEATAAAILGAPAMVVQRSTGNGRVEQMAAGARWLRLNLAATGAGLALRPVSQALQEYESVRPMREEIHARFAPPGETVQMLGLLGYAPRTPRTPRWPLESRMVDA